MSLTFSRNGPQGNIFTWVLSGTKIASLHVTGQVTGDNAATRTDPAGWSFTGSTQQGDYSWESATNRSGTFTFVVNHLTGVGIDSPTQAQYDYIDDTGKRILVDIPLTDAPGPAAVAPFVVGIVGALRRRKRRPF